MKFTMLEAAKERVQAYKNQCAENDQRRAAARKEIEKAKAEAQRLINRQIEGGEDVIDELAKAQARITVAEAKYQRLVQEIGEHNPEMNASGGISFATVSSQIRNYLNGGLEGDMKAELEELQAAKDQYLDAVEKALVKFYRLRQDYRQQILQAEYLFDQMPAGKVPDSFSEWLLRPFGLWWDVYDAANEMSPVKARAVEIAEGPAPVYEGVGYDNPNFEKQVTGGLVNDEK
jgi:hypothetical protein